MLRIAKGSVGELITQLQISKEAELADVEHIDSLTNEARVVARMLVRFIQHLEAKKSKAA